MSYFGNEDAGGGRPGFTEQPSNFGGGDFNQQSNSGQYNNGSNQNNSSGYSQSGGYGNSGGGQGGGGNSYGGSGGGGNRGNYGGGNGGGGNWKGNGGGGGWKGSNKGGFGNKPPMTPEQLAALQLPKRGIVLAGNFGAQEGLVPMIREIASIIKQNGFNIRASNLDGFDKLVVQNVPDAEFHIPWKGFNDCHNPANTYYSEKALEFAKRYHPEWGTLKDSHQKFFAKNVTLVLGKSLESHAHAAIIWSDDGVESPSNRGQRSAHAGHIAALCHATGIPVINISNPNAVQRLRALLEGNKQHG